MTRPGLARLVNALTRRPPFQFLVISEESRFGRESIEAAWTLKQITDVGVRCFFRLVNVAAEMEREKASPHVYDAPGSAWGLATPPARHATDRARWRWR